MPNPDFGQRGRRGFDPRVRTLARTIHTNGKLVTTLAGTYSDDGSFVDRKQSVGRFNRVVEWAFELGEWEKDVRMSNHLPSVKERMLRNGPSASTLTSRMKHRREVKNRAVLRQRERTRKLWLLSDPT